MTSPVAMAPDISSSLSSSSSSSSSSESPPSSSATSVAALRAAVLASPSSLTAHLSLIAHARKEADIPLLRSARHAAAAALPLPPSQWRSWLDDEHRLCTTSSDRAALLHGLHAAALRDYLAPDLHLRRLRLAAQTGVAEDVHLAFAEARRAGAAAHFTGGEPLWNEYRRFLRETAAPEDLQAQVGRAHAAMPVRGNCDAEAAAVARMEECEVFEAKLEAARGEGADAEDGKAGEEVVQCFRSYAAYAEMAAEELAVSVYERWVAESFLDVGVWEAYMRYCGAGAAEEKRLYGVAARAVRNVPWALWAWTELVLALPMALMEQAEEEKLRALRDVLERARPHVLKSGDLRGAELLTKAAWGSWLALGAPIKARGMVEAALDFNVPGSVQWAAATLSAAAVEKDMGGVGAERMEGVVGTRGHEARWWVEYARLMSRDGTEEARRIFERGIEGVADAGEVEAIVDAWVAYEFERTGKADLGGRLRRVYELGRVRIEKIAATMSYEGGAEEAKGARKGRAGKSRDRALPKRKRTKDAADEGAVESKGERKSKDGKEGKGGEGGGNKRTTEDASGERGADMMEEDEQEERGSDVATCGDGKPLTNGSTEKRPPPASSNDGADLNDAQAPQHRGTSRSSASSAPFTAAAAPNVATDTEPRTIFVCNLAFNASEDDVRGVFSEAGAIREVRMPRRSDGASRGRAYVEFESEEGVEAGLQRDKAVVRGRAIWVRRSKPPRRGRSRRARGAAGRGGLMQPRVVAHRRIVLGEGGGVMGSGVGGVGGIGGVGNVGSVGSVGVGSVGVGSVGGGGGGGGRKSSTKPENGDVNMEDKDRERDAGE